MLYKVFINIKNEIIWRLPSCVYSLSQDLQSLFNATNFCEHGVCVYFGMEFWNPFISLVYSSCSDYRII